MACARHPQTSPTASYAGAARPLVGGSRRATRRRRRATPAPAGPPVARPSGTCDTGHRGRPAGRVAISTFERAGRATTASVLPATFAATHRRRRCWTRTAPRRRRTGRSVRLETRPPGRRPLAHLATADRLVERAHRAPPRVVATPAGRPEPRPVLQHVQASAQPGQRPRRLALHRPDRAAERRRGLRLRQVLDPAQHHDRAHPRRQQLQLAPQLVAQEHGLLPALEARPSRPGRGRPRVAAARRHPRHGQVRHGGLDVPAGAWTSTSGAPQQGSGRSARGLGMTRVAGEQHADPDQRGPAGLDELAHVGLVVAAPHRSPVPPPAPVRRRHAPGRLPRREVRGPAGTRVG